MIYRWLTDDSLREEIRHLPPELKKKTKQALEWIANQPQSGKELRMELQGFRSYRMGGYRIVYRIIESDIRLIGVGHRKTIYERITAQVRRQS